MDYKTISEEKTKVIEEQRAEINRLMVMNHHLTTTNRSLNETVDRLTKDRDIFQEAFEQACDAGVAAEEEGGIICNLREEVAKLTRINKMLETILSEM